jgi:hypothetical protein
MDGFWAYPVYSDPQTTSSYFILPGINGGCSPSFSKSYQDELVSRQRLVHGIEVRYGGKSSISVPPMGVVLGGQESGLWLSLLARVGNNNDYLPMYRSISGHCFAYSCTYLSICVYIHTW